MSIAWRGTRPGRRSGGAASRSRGFWRMCRAAHRAWCGAIPTSSGCDARRTLRHLPRSRRKYSRPCGASWAMVVNCCMQPVRCLPRKTNNKSPSSWCGTRMHGVCRLPCRPRRMGNWRPASSMMGFTMRYCSKPRFFIAARVFLLALLLATSAVAKADGIEVKSAELEVVDEVLELNADLEIGLRPAIEETLNKGVPLNFIVEFEIKKPRWYWLDEV